MDVKGCISDLQLPARVAAQVGPRALRGGQEPGRREVRPLPEDQLSHLSDPALLRQLLPGAESRFIYPY